MTKLFTYFLKFIDKSISIIHIYLNMFKCKFRKKEKIHEIFKFKTNRHKSPDVMFPNVVYECVSSRWSYNTGGRKI